MTDRLALALVVLATLVVWVLDAPPPGAGSVAELAVGRAARSNEANILKLEATRPSGIGPGAAAHSPNEAVDADGGGEPRAPMARAAPIRPAGDSPKQGDGGPLPPADTTIVNWVAPLRSGEGEGSAAASSPLPGPPHPERDVTERSGSHGVDGLAMDGNATAPGSVDVGRSETRTGIATWYGLDFAGLRMANGKPYNPYAMTTASNRWPLGTVLEVEYRKVVTVTVTDRGAFTHELDLSLGAFKALVGSVDPGVIPITVRVVE